MTDAEPLTLSALGSFTVGGRRIEVSAQPTQTVRLSADLPNYVVDPNGTYPVEHAYVQYFVPASSHRLPVLFVHGGGMTGACWETTPDGRSGWLQYFLRDGRPAYVVDNVERGRAGWCPYGLTHQHAPLLRSEQEAWDVFRIGPPDGYPRRRPYEGCLFPCGNLEQLARQQVPRWTTTTELSVAAVVELIDVVGRCVVIAHSQGGGIAARAIAEKPDSVAALALVEPHGLPEAKAFAGSRTCRQLIVAGDFIDHSPMYRRLRARWFTYLDALREIGVAGEYIDLPEIGHSGNSHLPMMDHNSDDIAALIGHWLNEQD
jgi:pimeloyl-ACP methyl ester carboxylesterase